MDWLEKSKVIGRFRWLRSNEKTLIYEFRDNPTKAERAMWEILRDKRLGGYKFRRQHKIGPYIADFYCHSVRLVVEVDGGVHDEEHQKERDNNRDLWLNSIGLKIVHVRNEEVLTDPEAVQKRLLDVVSKE